MSGGTACFRDICVIVDDFREQARSYRGFGGISHRSDQCLIAPRSAHLDLPHGRKQNQTRRFHADELEAPWQAAFYAQQRCGEDRAGHNKTPAQGALANGLKLPRCRDVA